MACSICGREGHNKRTCGRGASYGPPASYTPTPPPVVWQPPAVRAPSPFHPHTFVPAPPVRRGMSAGAVVLLVLAGLVASSFAGCILCVAIATPGRPASTAAAEATSTAQRPASVAVSSQHEPSRAPAPPAQRAASQTAAPAPRPPAPAHTSAPPPRAPAAAAPASPPKSSPGASGGGRALCCDGTLSPSCGCGGGRGCCSRHGGVCGCQ